MKTVYIEHSYLVNENNWDKIGAFFSGHPDFEFIASDWTVIEISQATDKEQAHRRVDFIESLNPKWLLIKTEIQKFEVKSFLYRYLYCSMAPYSVFTDQFHKAVAVSIGRKPDEGCKLWNFVEAYIDDPDILAPIKAQKEIYLQCFGKLASMKKKDIQKKDKEIIGHWIKDVLPDTKPNGCSLNDVDKQQAIALCLSNVPKFLEECPYFNFENTLFDIRFQDKERKSQESDVIDLEHACCAVPYCDFVVTGDRYLKSISDRANVSLKMAKIFSCVSDLRIFLSKNSGNPEISGCYGSP